MSIHEMFEYTRRANADFYTANPLEQMSDDDLAALAKSAEMTVEELRDYMNKPHIEMTCPLCGRASTHLTMCKGCGGDAWGGELVLGFGEGIHSELRQAYKAALLTRFGGKPATVRQEAIEYATKNAYSWGGCMVCVECWHNTLPAEAFRTCPIKLIADKTLYPDPGQVLHRFPSLLFALQGVKDAEERKRLVADWMKATFDYWTELWNTVPPEERKDVAVWRGTLLEAGMGI